MTFGKKGRILVLALATGVCGTSAWLVARNRTSAPPVKAATGSVREADTTRDSIPAHVRSASERGSPWRVGTELRYTVDFGTTLEALGGAGDDERSLSLTGTARLTLTAARVDENRIVLAGRVSEVALAVGNDKAFEHRLGEAVTAGIERPFRVTLAKNGRIEELSTHRDVRGMPHAILRSVLGALQFVAPETAGVSEWQTLETDQYGTFEAQYRRAEPRRFAKKKLGYTKLELAEVLTAGARPVPPTVDASADFELDERGLIRRVAAREAVLLPLGDSGFETASHATLVLEHVGEGRADVLAEAELVTGPLWVTRAAARAADELESKRELVAGATFSELASQLEDLRSRELGSERLDWMRRTTALLDLDPSSIEELAERLRNGTSVEDQELLLGALSDSNAPEAQTALADIARDEALDARLRSDATSHLGFQEQPTAETFATLERLAENGPAGVNGAATLALGGAARRAGESGAASEAAERAISALVRSAARATTPEAQRTAIDALGNSGSAEALPAIRAALASPSPALRAAAVAALRHIPGEEADRLVAQTLQTDGEPLVRAAAADVFGQRTMTELGRSVVVAALGTDLAENVRLALVDVIGGWLELDPALRPVLQATADHDASKYVRTAAVEALKVAATRGG